MLRTLSLCTCCRHYPGAAPGRTCFAHSPRRISLPRYGSQVGLRIVLFEACSAFTRVTACTLALSPIRDTLPEGFSHFVSSIAAPVASGWSGCRVGLTPTGKRRLATAHANARQLRTHAPQSTAQSAHGRLESEVGACDAMALTIATDNFRGRHHVLMRAAKNETRFVFERRPKRHVRRI